MIKATDNLAVEVTDWKARFIGFAMTVAGCVGAGLTAKTSTPWVSNTALAIATTLVSTGALSLFFELALRRNVYREMMRLVGINRGISAQQLVGAGPITSLNWHEIYQARSQLSFLLINPQSWIEQNVSRVFDGARQRPSRVSFFFPDPQGPYFDDWHRRRI